MTVEENYRQLEPKLKDKLELLRVLNVSTEQQEMILKLLKYDIDKAYLNGFKSAMDYAKNEIKTIEI